jgi:esterase/lipase superfamily enzyme
MTASRSTLWKGVLASLASLVLAGCGISIPDASSIAASCRDYVAVPPDNADASVFFVSSSIPDCDHKDGARFLGYRYPGETYGKGYYSTEEKTKKIKPLVSIETHEQWLNEIEADVIAANGRLTIFIHGYNNTFIDAFRRGAAIHKIQDRDVPVVVINWPSRAKIAGYTVDEASIAWAQDSINNRLAELTTIADDITIIAHSMGTRAAINGTLALDRMRKVRVAGTDQIEEVRPETIKRIVLAAGDVDRDAVLRKGGSIDLLTKRKPWSHEEELSPRRQMLIYASYRDLPIQLSRRVHGYARLGTTSCKHDIDAAKHRLGSEGNCHRTSKRNGLLVVSTSKIDEEGRLNHADFIDNCRTKAHLGAFLRDSETRPYESELPGDSDALSGYEIDIFGGEPCIDDEDDD